jgi:hypothetical protein
MVEPLFVSAEEWMENVHRVLTHPGAIQEMSAMGLELDTLLAVARVEATLAGTDGSSSLSHQQLAELSGVPRTEVLLTRLFLIDLGLQSLSMSARAPGGVLRLLHQS